VVAVLGEPFGATGEGHSVADIRLDPAQTDAVRRLKQLGKKVVAVITAGRPLDLSELEREADAILYVWHGGTQTGPATAAVLFGEVCPSGRLPMTFPRATGQIPLYYNCPPTAHGANGYSCGNTARVNYEDVLSTPLYPFGYGLSYTEFACSEPWCQKEKFTREELRAGIAVSVTVSNVGRCGGKEVVQLYVRDPVSTYTRPFRELKGAEKVFLSPGESKKVEFTLTEESLGYYMPNGDFAVEKGEFLIFVGHDCRTENKITIELC